MFGVWIVTLWLSLQSSRSLRPWYSTYSREFASIRGSVPDRTIEYDDENEDDDD